jgi:hypothetical protein
MSTRNFDSSLLTKRRQAKALGAYASAITAANSTAAGIQTQRTTQPTYQSAVVVVEQNLGKCYCVNDAKANPYPFNPQNGGCGCGIGPS